MTSPRFLIHSLSLRLSKTLVEKAPATSGRDGMQVAETRMNISALEFSRSIDCGRPESSRLVASQRWLLMKRPCRVKAV